MTDPLVAKFGSYLLMVISPRSPMSGLNFILKKFFMFRRILTWLPLWMKLMFGMLSQQIRN